MQDKYYAASGRFSIMSFILLVVAVAIMPVLAALYSAVIWYNPIIYGNFIATLAYAFAVAMMFSFLVMRLGKVRNTAVGLLFGLIAAIVSFVGSWSTFFAIMTINMNGLNFQLEGFIELSLAYAQNPMLIWTTMQEVAVDGIWTIKSLELKGGILWGIWAIEGLVIFGAPFVTVAGYASEPFCEEDGKWAKKVEFEDTALAPCTDRDALVNKLEAEGSAQSLMDMDVIALEEDDKRPHMKVTIYSCRSCAYLSLENHQGEDDLEDGSLPDGYIVDCLRISLQSAQALSEKLA